MTNITQCPNCSSIFAITDDQFRASKGKVRCGSCREKFVVEFLPQSTNLVVNKDVLTGQNTTKTEPSLFEQSKLLRILSEHAKNEVDEDATDTQKETEYLPDPLEEDVEFLDSEDIKVQDTSFDQYANSVTDYRSDNAETNDHQFALSTEENSIEATSHTVVLDEGSLINEALLDEVDILIESKLIGVSHQKPDIDNVFLTDNEDYADGLETSLSDSTDDEPFNLKPSRFKVFKNAGSLFSLIFISLILLCGLIFQLWLKQALPDQLAKPLLAVTPFVQPLFEKVTETYNIKVPVREDLNNLRLVSAQTEAHPSRASTILLRVSLLNRSKIEQPLPNLELSLSDENGQLVSRRSFSAEDYLYNNATDNLISANELKKVTIEFLAFPKQAHGYELKMVQ